MPIITNEVLFNKIEKLEKLVTRLIVNEAVMTVEEVSLAKVAKMLGKGEKTIKRWVEQDGFPAREVENGKSKNGKTYVFRLQDILEYQQRNRFRADMKQEIKENDEDTIDGQENLSDLTKYLMMQREKRDKRKLNLKK